MPDSLEQKDVWKYIATGALSALAMVFLYWFVSGNSMVLQQHDMGNAIITLQQRVNDLQKEVQVDQADQEHDIKLDHDIIVTHEDKIHQIMNELPPVSFDDYRPAPHKK